MRVALLTNYLTSYRVPLYERLARSHGVEVLCFGGGDRYVPAWFSDIDRQLDRAPFPARRLGGQRAALGLARRYDAVFAPFAGGAVMPAAYAGTRRHGKPFVLWASVWAQPRSVAHALSLPAIRHIYRHSDAVIAYGEHVRRFVAGVRGRDADVFVAPQSVEPELFAREIARGQTDAFRDRHDLRGPLALYAGRLVPEKGVGVLLDAWSNVQSNVTLVIVGDGPLADAARATPRVRLLGPLPRDDLPVAYAAAELALLPSIPTARFREPWGLVCNEAMHQGRPVIATTAVGAVAGGLVRDQVNGVVVAPADARALGEAVDRLMSDAAFRARLGASAKISVAPYTYERMVEAFDRALSVATGAARRTYPRRRR
jgi:glycosyltransferase involved in cell wall biosynthesis